MRLFGIFLLLRALNYVLVAGLYLPPSSVQIFIESISGYLILLAEPVLFFVFLSIVFPVKLIIRRCWLFLLPAIILGTVYTITYLSYPETDRSDISRWLLNPAELKSYPQIFRLQHIIQLCEFVLILFYLTLYVKIFILNFPKFLRNNFSNNKQIKTRRFFSFGFILICFTGLYTVIPFIGGGIIVPIIIMEIGFAFLMYSFLYIRYRVNYNLNADLLETYFTSFMVDGKRPLIIEALFPQKLIPQNIMSVLADPKLPDKMDYLFHRLTDYFRTKKPYLQSNLSLDDVARNLNTNRTYISLILKKETTSFYDFVNSYRIEEAKQKMQTCSFNLKIIAEECGFSSYTTFIKYFEKKEQVSPKIWRDRIVLRSVVQ